MKISVFMIRNKENNELIYLQGIDSMHTYPNFYLDKKWLTYKDLTKRNKSWREIKDSYYFDKELRHLFDYEYDLVKFSVEEVEIQ